jgi:hypothetical protein
MNKEARAKTYTDRVKWANNLLDKITPTGKITGVEVGLWKADFAQQILRSNNRLYWYGVDPYFEYGKRHRRQKDWDGTFKRVMDKMSTFGDRFTMIRKPSNKGVKDVPDNVDFVWIDGNHDYEFVIKDLLLYEKKVRSGGVMAGHDYFIQGVREAVDDHAKKFKRDINTNNDFDPYGVFWWIMP